jgi:hypothetical protein
MSRLKRLSVREISQGSPMRPALEHLASSMRFSLDPGAPRWTDSRWLALAVSVRFMIALNGADLANAIGWASR